MDTFHFKGISYPYFHHNYNTTWDNERCVEVPILRAICQESEYFLEIGNVLGHYQKSGHPVVDKFEKSPGVINMDLFDFRTADPVDLVISISTFEHIGFDEPPRPGKGASEIVSHALSFLSPGGRLVFTIPIGYNASMDHFLSESKHVSFMKRIGKREWIECGPEALTLSYGKPFPCANALAIYDRVK